MKPYLADPDFTLYNGDVLEVLRGLPDGSVHTCVTSPPYWGLRDYGVDGQLGLEPSPEEYVARMVAVFREVRRVLRADGTLWLNIGDSYAGKVGGAQGEHGQMATRSIAQAREHRRRGRLSGGTKTVDASRGAPLAPGLKSKDLVGIPWLLAFALRADGWYLRADIIWSKPNPMPESVTDRPTKAHEYLFLLAKSPRYFYDADAIREPLADITVSDRRFGTSGTGRARYSSDGKASCPSGFTGANPAGRNKRSVWTITTEPYPEAHFATFPTALVEPCILAGSPIGGTVLDPFSGSGTTALVARNLGRRAIGIELSADYCALAARRLAQQSLLAQEAA